MDLFSHIVTNHGVAGTVIWVSRSVCEDKKYIDRLVYVCHDVVLLVN